FDVAAKANRPGLVQPRLAALLRALHQEDAAIWIGDIPGSWRGPIAAAQHAIRDPLLPRWIGLGSLAVDEAAERLCPSQERVAIAQAVVALRPVTAKEGVTIDDEDLRTSSQD